MATELIVTYKGEAQVLKVEDTDIVCFPSGLVGFPECRHFVLIEDPEEAPIAVLQCLDDPAMSFLVTDPWYLSADYRFHLTDEDKQELGIERTEEGRVICTLSAKQGPLLVTADLLGPIVINPGTRAARQIVLQDSNYSAQHPVLNDCRK